MVLPWIPLGELKKGGKYRHIPYHPTPGMEDATTFFFKVYVLGHSHTNELSLLTDRHSQFVDERITLAERDVANNPPAGVSGDHGDEDDAPISVTSSHSSPGTVFYPPEP